MKLCAHDQLLIICIYTNYVPMLYSATQIDKIHTHTKRKLCTNEKNGYNWVTQLSPERSLTTCFCASICNALLQTHTHTQVHSYAYATQNNIVNTLNLPWNAPIQILSNRKISLNFFLLCAACGSRLCVAPPTRWNAALPPYHSQNPSSYCI